MNKYISRTKNRIALVLFFSFLLLLLLGKALSSGIMMLIALIIFIAGNILMFDTNRCPYCGTFFRGLSWSKPDAGHCVKCGKLIEFDDCDNKK